MNELGAHTQPDRNAGIDIYKILCMFFVIWYHFMLGGKVHPSANEPVTIDWLILSFSAIFGGICNCAFVLCTGYFLCQKSFSFVRILKLWLQVLFYTLLCGTVTFMAGTEAFSVKAAVKLLLPFTFGEYWFFTDYILLILLSPVLNLLIGKMDRKTHLCLVVFMFVINSWFPTLGIPSEINKFSYTFVFLYVTGAYLKLYGNALRLSRTACGGVGLASFLLGEMTVFVVRASNSVFGKEDFIGMFVMRTESFFCVLTAVFLLVWFSGLKIRRSAGISFVSSSLFAVYLSHSSPRMMRFFFQHSWLFDSKRTYNTGWMLPQILLCSCLIFAGSILIDKLRILLLERPLFHLLQKPSSPVKS